MKTKLERIASWYGVISSITDTTVTANIYTTDTHEFVDAIDFSLLDLLPLDISDANVFVAFSMKIGYIGKKPYMNIRLIRR